MASRICRTASITSYSLYKALHSGGVEICKVDADSRSNEEYIYPGQKVADVFGSDAACQRQRCRADRRLHCAYFVNRGGGPSAWARSRNDVHVLGCQLGRSRHIGYFPLIFEGDATEIKPCP